MRDVSHCKIRWDENEEEYADFYDLDTANKRFPLWLDGAPKPNEVQATQNTTAQTAATQVGTGMYVNKSNELVLVGKNKSLGHRSLQMFYNQRPHYADRQLITSLLQEHKRLAAIQQQKEKNLDHQFIQNQRQYQIKTSMAGNKAKHFRNQNPI